MPTRRTRQIRGDGLTSVGLALSSAGARMSYAWTPNVSKTLASFQVWMGGRTGSSSALTRLDVYLADSAGRPTGSSLANSSPTTPNSAGQTWGGMALAVTAGTTYCLVLSNPDATPATNFGTAVCGGPVVPGAPTWVSSDSGATWTTPATWEGSGLVRCVYSDATSHGSHVSRTLRTSAHSVAVWSASGSRKALVGVEVVPESPGGLVSAVFALRSTGTPPECRAYLYQGTTLLASSDNTVTAAPGGSTTDYAFLFSGLPALAAGTAYQIVLGTVLATAGDASNLYSVMGNTAWAASTETMYEGYRAVTSSAATLSAWTYDVSVASAVVVNLEPSASGSTLILVDD